jgi:predicted nucleic acid-binding Zn finger protein
MVTIKQAQGIAERLAKAEQLVAEGAVLPVAGLSGYAVVRNGDGSSMYLVRFEQSHEHCTCPDFQQRQKAAGLPCKHLLAAQLALGSNPQSPAPVAADPVTPELVERGVKLLVKAA